MIKSVTANSAAGLAHPADPQLRIPVMAMVNAAGLDATSGTHTYVYNGSSQVVLDTWTIDDSVFVKAYTWAGAVKVSESDWGEISVTGSGIAGSNLVAAFMRGTGSVQWTRTPISGGVTADIANANALTYGVTVADRGYTITPRVTAYQPSLAGKAVPIVAPLAPTITAFASAGADAVKVTFTRNADNGGAAITGDRAQVYNAANDLLMAEANGVSPITLTGLPKIPLYARVASINSVGLGLLSAVSQTATPTGTGQSAPTVSSAPIILGTPTEGVSVSATAGVFTGSPTPTVVRDWLVAGIVVATAANYTPVTADAGKVLTTRETASNGVGSPAVSTSTGVTIAAAAAAAKASGTMRMVGTSAQVLAASPVTFAGGVSTYLMKIQAQGAAIGCRISVHNLSPNTGMNWVKASVAATDIAAVDTIANAYNAWANGTTHNVTAGADPLGFRKATWDGGATQSRRLEPTDAVLPSFGYNNQQDTVTSDIITGLVPKRATDRANEEYYYMVRLAVGSVQNYDGVNQPAATAITSPIAEYTASNGADSPFWHGGDLGLTDGVDGTYTLPAAINASKMPVISIEWIYAPTTPAYTFVHPGDSITEGYQWPRLGVQRKSTPAKPLHHVNLGGSTTRTGSYLGNMYLYMQSNAKPDYVVMPIISVNNYSPLSDFILARAQEEMARLQEVEVYLTGLGIKIIWWTPFNFGANPAPGDLTSAWGYLYNTAKAYAATKNITFMDINGDPRLVRSVYNASTNPTGWIAPDQTHPSNPPGIQGFATAYGETLTALGF